MIRDSHSKALLETDVSQLQKYRKEKRRDRDMQELQKDVQDLKERINRLCETLQKIEAKCE